MVGAAAAPGLRERKKMRNRATMIDAAIELCLRHGFEKTTVDQIAALADVSPRTFSRYFTTKEAVILALIDDAIEVAAAELARQPAELNDLEALFKAYIGMYRRVKSGAGGELTPRLLMSTVQIIVCSPALRQAASDFRGHSANVALARRMGVGLDDRRLRLVVALWTSIIMTGLGDLGPTTNWEHLSIDDLVARIEDTYAQFIDVVAGLRSPA